MLLSRETGSVSNGNMWFYSFWQAFIFYLPSETIAAIDWTFFPCLTQWNDNHRMFSHIPLPLCQCLQSDKCEISKESTELRIMWKKQSWNISKSVISMEHFSSFVYLHITYTEYAAEIIIIKNFHFDNLKIQL